MLVMLFVTFGFKYSNGFDNGIKETFYKIKHYSCFDKVKLTANYHDDGSIKNVVLLNVDCPEKTDFYITLPSPVGCGCNQWSINFGGENFKVYPENKVAPPSFTMNSSSLKAGKYRFNLPVNQNINKESNLNVRIHCGKIDYMWISKDFQIQVVSNGGKYEVYEGSDGNGYGEPEELDFPDVCCCEKKCPTSNICIKSYTTEVSRTHDNKTLISAVINSGEKNNSFKTNLSIPLSLNGEFSERIYINEVKNALSTQNCLPVPDKGQCIKVCARLVWKYAKYTQYVANCNGTDVSLDTFRKIFPESVGLQLINCDFQFPVQGNICPQINKKA